MMVRIPSATTSSVVHNDDLSRVRDEGGVLQSHHAVSSQIRRGHVNKGDKLAYEKQPPDTIYQLANLSGLSSGCLFSGSLQPNTQPLQP